MKLENNWQNKRLENLEKDIWDAPEYDSHLVLRVHQLRKIPLNEFTVEDLRILIGQQRSLVYLIPLAINVMKTDLFAEGDNYPGDLLKNVLDVDILFWQENIHLWLEVSQLICERRFDIEKIKYIKTNKFDSFPINDL